MTFKNKTIITLVLILLILILISYNPYIHQQSKLRLSSDYPLDNSMLIDLRENN